MTELTGWKPIPQEFCDSNCLADAKGRGTRFNVSMNLQQHRPRPTELRMTRKSSVCLADIIQIGFLCDRVFSSPHYHVGMIQDGLSIART